MPDRLRRVLSLVAGATMMLVAGCTAGATDPQAGPTSKAVEVSPAAGGSAVEPGTFAVGERSETHVDTSRPTKAHKDQPEKPERTLPVMVLYPSTGTPGDDAVGDAPPAVDRGPFPLVVFSHGVGAFGGAYKETLEVIASAGYVVVAPTYPLSNSKTPGGATINDADQQTADVSFLLDRYTEAAAAPSGPWTGLIDPEALAVAGHSLGGITSIGVGVQDCCADPRLDAMAEWSGVLLPLGAEGGELAPEAADLPVLIVHGDADNVVPYGAGEAFYDMVQGPKHFVTLTGEGHVSAFVQGTDAPASAVTTLATIDFFDAYVKGDESGLERLREDVGTDPALATLEEETG